MAGGPLLERDRELAALTGLLDELRTRGRGGAALIEGAAGIGKSALLAAALDAAGDEPTVLRARGSELEAGLAFGGVRQLFGGLVQRMENEQRAALLTGPAALARPVLGLEEHAAARPPSLADPLYGLYWLAAELADRAPLVLAFDDLHWLDEESGRFVAYLAQRLEVIAIAVLATARPDEPGALNEPAAELRAHAMIVSPRALSVDAVSTLLPARAAGDAHRVTGGNPLFVVELGRSLDQRPGASLEEVGSATVARVVLRRVANVSEDAAALARAVALFAAGASIEDAADVAGLDVRAAADAADGLIAAEVLADGDPLAFLHPVMRTAVYEELGSFERRRGHARAAALLKQRGAAAEEIAAHLLAGAPDGDPDNVAILREAADVALAGSAPRAAVRYLERALAEPPPPGPARAALRHEVGRLQLVLGSAQAERTLREALAESDGAARIDVAIDLGLCLVLGNDGDAAVELLERAREAGELDPERRLMIDSLIAGAAWDGATPEAYRAAVSRLPPGLPGNTKAERMALAALAYDRYCRLEPVETVAELVLRAAEDASSNDDPLDLTSRGVSILLEACGELDVAQALTEHELAQARESGAEALFCAAQVRTGDLAFIRGALRDASASYQTALQAPGLATYDRVHANLMLARAAGDARRSRAGGRRRPRAGRRHDARTSRARRRRRAGRARELRRGPARLRAPRRRARPARLGQPGRAALAPGVRAGAGRLRPRARGGGDDGALPRRRAALRRAAADRDRPPGARHRRARSPAPGTGRRRPAQLALPLVRGARGAGAGQRHAPRPRHGRLARAPALRAGLRRARGAAPIGERAREELKLAGVRPRRGRLSGVEALTPSEERIARLAAGGMSNKAIAQHLS